MLILLIITLLLGQTSFTLEDDRDGIWERHGNIRLLVEPSNDYLERLQNEEIERQQRTQLLEEERKENIRLFLESLREIDKIDESIIELFEKAIS
jgi:hypothetical protein